VIEKVKFRYKLYKLLKKRRQLRKEYDVKILQAKKKRLDRNKIDRLKFDRFHADKEIKEQISALMTEHLYHEATNRCIPFPTGDANWVSCDTLDREVLTDSAITELRKALREDRKENLNVWIPIICALTGLFSVIVSLVLAFK